MVETIIFTMILIIPTFFMLSYGLTNRKEIKCVVNVWNKENSMEFVILLIILIASNLNYERVSHIIRMKRKG